MVLQTQGSHRTLTPPEKSSRVNVCHLRKCMILTGAAVISAWPELPRGRTIKHPVVKLKFPRRRGFFLEGNTHSIVVQLQAMVPSLTLETPAPWPWFVPSKARGPIFFVVKPETRSFTFFLYSLELQSSMIQREHPYTVFLIFKRMCKYSLGEMWQSLLTCTLVHRAFSNTKWITQSHTCTRS